MQKKKRNRKGGTAMQHKNKPEVILFDVGGTSVEKSADAKTNKRMLTFREDLFFLFLAYVRKICYNAT